MRQNLASNVRSGTCVAILLREVIRGIYLSKVEVDDERIRFVCGPTLFIV